MIFPLQDGFETQLSQAWDGSVGTISVLTTPSYTPKTTETYIVVNPGKTNMQVAKINDYDASGKTMTVSDITLEKGMGINSTAQNHSAGSKVIISDNYEFWKGMADAGTKSGNNTWTGDNTFNEDVSTTKSLRIPFYADAAARATAIPSPADGMLYYQNDVEEFYGYKNGAWQTLGSGGGGSAVWYQDSTGDGTITGAINGVNTTYVLSHTPGSVDAMILTYNGQVMERGATDDYTIVANTITMNFAPVSGRLVAIYPDQGVGTQNATTRATTDADSVNGELYRSTDDSNSLYYKDNAGDTIKVIDVTTNKVPTTILPTSTNAAIGAIRIATDAEVTTGTSQVLAVNPLQLANSSASSNTSVFTTFTRTTNQAGSTVTITHGLGRTPKTITISAVPQGATYGLSFGTCSIPSLTQYCLYRCTGDGTSTAISASCAAYVTNSLGTHGVIGNVNSTTFDIVWTQTGASTSNSMTFLATIM